MAKHHRSAHHRRVPKKRWKTSRILSWAGLAGLAAAIGVLGFYAVAAGGEGETRRSVRQAPVISEERRVTVDVVDNDFEPRHLTVRPGAEVTWAFEGRAPHNITDDGGAFASGNQDRGDKYIMTFDEPGTYDYICTLHHAMQGTLVVAP